MYQFRLYGLIAALVLAGCGHVSPAAEVINATTAHLQPILDSAFNICRTARTEIERHGGDASRVIAECEALAEYARLLRKAQDAACEADPGCE
jgi:hypothetical protein